MIQQLSTYRRLDTVSEGKVHCVSMSRSRIPLALCTIKHRSLLFVGLYISDKVYNSVINENASTDTELFAAVPSH